MVRPPHPITARIASAPLVLAACTALATLGALGSLGACVNKQELRTARTSVYDADFAIVYSAVLDAVRGQYPTLDDDPVKGKISTSWHQVQMESPDDQMQVAARDPSGLGAPTSQPGLTSGQGRAVRRTFVRFDVSVLGGRPWHVRVVGHASKWEPGDAVPVELRDADTPQWLPGRTDALVVAIYRRLRGYARAAAGSEPVAETAVVDLGAFGPIPAPAAQAAARVRQAVTARDFAALRAATAADVTWSFGAAPGIDDAFITWQGDPDVLDQLAAALDAGCRTDGDKRVACPPAAVEQPGYTGWRVVFEPRGKAWAMTAFVQGD